MGRIMIACQTHSRRAQRHLTLIDFALLLAWLAALLAWFFDPFQFAFGPIHGRISWGLKPIVVPLLLLLLRVVFARAHATELASAARPRRLPKAALAVFMTLLVLALAEALLARVGVPAGEPVFLMHGQGGTAMRDDGSMVKDADLLWRFESGKVFNGRTVNALGFLDREVTAAKPPGMRRVICMGDSCTAQGTPPYSGHLNNLLKEKSPDGQPWEAFNTAVHGYTVLQGLALFRTRVASFSPDIVTIMFGWNDHWLAPEEDVPRLARVGSPALTAVRNALARKRLVVALTRKAKPDKNDVTVRVPPAVYAQGLRDLIAAIRQCGGEPLLMTAPRADTISGHLVNAGHARSKAEALRLHDEYADITRRVAREENARLFDLALAFTNAEYFSRDGVHYQGEGIAHIAQLLHHELLEWNPPLKN